MTDMRTAALDKNLAKLLLAAVFMGIVFFFLNPWAKDIPLAWLIKSSGIILLAVIAFLSQKDRSKGLALGLLFGAGGDILLQIGMFVPGLGSFLVSHIVYTILFVLVMRETGMNGAGRKGLALAVAIIGVLLARWLAPDLGDLTVPVMAYIAVIACMTICAALTPFTSRRVIIGAVLFMLSDSLIALGKFKTGFPGIHHAVWATYFAAQYCITTGFLAGWKRR